VTATGRAGSSSLRTYYFSTDGGKTYSSVSSSSTSASKTFSGLSAGTSYNIKVYVVDSGGKSSTTYSTGATTLSNVAPSITNVVVSDITSTSFKITATGKAGTGTLQTYYFSVNGGSTYYSVSSTSTTASREFTGLTKNTTYNIKVYVKDSNNLSSSVYSTTGRTGATLADTCRSGSALYSCIENSFVDQGVNDLYHHTSSLAYGTGDNSYRYAGADPNNYICFGKVGTTCDNDHLYRIIGVFDEDGDEVYNVKLIKADVASINQLGTIGDYKGKYSKITSEYKGSLIANQIGEYYFNYNIANSFSNDWDSSLLNTINLNTNYLNAFGDYADLIRETNWYTGSRSNSATVKEFKNSEPVSQSKANKIGLMYVSDYGYAASSDAWTNYLYDYQKATIVANNWMFKGLNEWTMAKFNTTEIFITYAVHPNHNSTVYDGAVSPVFYLNFDVDLIGGSGTKSDPFRIKL